MDQKKEKEEEKSSNYVRYKTICDKNGFCIVRIIPMEKEPIYPPLSPKRSAQSRRTFNG